MATPKRPMNPVDLARAAAIFKTALARAECDHRWGVTKQVEVGVRKKELWWWAKCQCCPATLARPTFAELQEAMKETGNAK